MTATEAPDVAVRRFDEFGDYPLAYVQRRKFSKEQREKLAKSGHALPWGGFPIENCGDVGNAVRAIGRAKDRGQTIAHIKKWHGSLGCKTSLPSEWKSMAAAEFAAIGPLRRVMPVLRTKSLLITKVAQDKQTGVRRWYAKASGVERDLYDERMSLDLFKDFIRRAEAREAVPEPFSSEAWNGGLPYLGVAHYLDLGGAGIVGRTAQLWLDGNLLKASGTFEGSPIAEAAFRSIDEDIKQDRPLEQRVRISIAFLDWAHDHEGSGEFKRKSLTERCEMCSSGAGEKVYKAGQLVHLALTRIPAYPSATIELEERAMGEKSNRQLDAESIVGEHADVLEEKDRELVGRSADVDPSAIVVRQDEDEEDEEMMDEEEMDEEMEDEEGGGKKKRKGKRPFKGAAPAYGGAKSLAEAESFLVREAAGAPVLLDSLNVLAGVLTNVAGAEHRDFIQGVLADYQTRLDAQVVKTLGDVRSVLKEATMSDEPVTQPTTPVAGAEAAAAAAEATAPVVAEEQAKHVLDEALLGLRTAFDEARATPVDAKARLGMLQQAVDGVAVAVAKNIGDQPAVATAGVSPDALVAAVQAAVAPLAAELAAVKGLISKAAPAALPRRAIQAGSLLAAKSVVGQAPEEVIMEADLKNPRSDRNVTPGLRNLVRRTVFGNGGG